MRRGKSSARSAARRASGRARSSVRRQIKVKRARNARVKRNGD